MAEHQDGSILSKLYTAISPIAYSDYINYIVPRDGMSLSDFQCSKLSKDYWVDTRCCFDQGVVNVDMLFELFCKVLQNNTITVRANMIGEVKSYKAWYE